MTIHPTIEIHIRDRDVQRLLIDKGIEAILNTEILKDVYVKDVDCYQEELIIYLGDKYDAHIRRITDITRPSKAHIAEIPRFTKQ